MQKFLDKVKEQAKKNPKKIVFPEGEEERILRAVEVVLKEKIAFPILIGDPKKISNEIKKYNLDIDLEKVEIHNPENSELTKKFQTIFFELRKHKGMTEEKALETVKEMNYFGTMLVHQDLADGMVTGTICSTGDSIRPALQIIKTKEKFHKVSGVFFMVLEDRLLLFADSAITVDPTPHDLVDIALDTAETAKKFGIEPKIALLSFSTNSSANHPFVEEVKQAVAMIEEEAPKIKVGGEMQVDAALVPEVAARKCPDSEIQGDANILIFPNLESANIGYKLVERLAKATAIGPILQGLKKPINDLSRGCKYQDIVDITAFTVCECQELDK